jgi:hypothetical protein
MKRIRMPRIVRFTASALFIHHVRVGRFIASTQVSRVFFHAAAPTTNDERRTKNRQFCPLNPSHETFACQFTNAPVGFSFHAHTCRV